MTYKTFHIEAKIGIEENEASPDIKKLSQELNTTLNSIRKDGFEVVDIKSIIAGKYDCNFSAEGAYGYSYTKGFIIVAKTINETE